MPKIKRYWPCSHGFNRDPQVIELRKKYGDWMGFVWQEMCAIGDLNDGIVQGTANEFAVTQSYISLVQYQGKAVKKIEQAIEYMADRGWIFIRKGGEFLSNPARKQFETSLNLFRNQYESGEELLPNDCFLILKYAKYHTTQTEKRFPPNDRTTERPKRELPALPPPVDNSKKNSQIEEIFRVAKNIAGDDKDRARELCNFVGKTVKDGLRFGDSEEVINDAILWTFDQLKARRVKEGKPLDQGLLWPYLQKTYKFKRTKALETESDKYKREPMQKAGAILDQLMQRKA